MIKNMSIYICSKQIWPERIKLILKRDRSLNRWSLVGMIYPLSSVVIVFILKTKIPLNVTELIITIAHFTKTSLFKEGFMQMLLSMFS